MNRQKIKRFIIRVLAADVVSLAACVLLVFGLVNVILSTRWIDYLVSGIVALLIGGLVMFLNIRSQKIVFPDETTWDLKNYFNTRLTIPEDLNVNSIHSDWIDAGLDNAADLLNDAERRLRIDQSIDSYYKFLSHNILAYKLRVLTDLSLWIPGYKEYAAAYGNEAFQRPLEPEWYDGKEFHAIVDRNGTPVDKNYSKQDKWNRQRRFGSIEYFPVRVFTQSFMEEVKQLNTVLEL